MQQLSSAVVATIHAGEYERLRATHKGPRSRSAGGAGAVHDSVVGPDQVEQDRLPVDHLQSLSDRYAAAALDQTFGKAS
jgi:hypothetical protein